MPLTALTHSRLFVLDQDQALDFYVGTLGLEVAEDVELGFMRWLTIRVPGHPELEVLLERPGPPSLDDATAAQLRELIAKGGGGTLIFATDDCHATYDELRAKGVEFSEEPTERPYGIDCALRDPSGNAIRITQRA